MRIMFNSEATCTFPHSLKGEQVEEAGSVVGINVCFQASGLSYSFLKTYYILLVAVATIFICILHLSSISNKCLVLAPFL